MSPGIVLRSTTLRLPRPRPDAVLVAPSSGANAKSFRGWPISALSAKVGFFRAVQLQTGAIGFRNDNQQAKQGADMHGLTGYMRGLGLFAAGIMVGTLLMQPSAAQS